MNTQQQACLGQRPRPALLALCMAAPRHCATLPQNGRKMMKRRIACMLIPMFGVPLIVGSALGAGMMMFKSEQKAQQHCPSDTVVWLNTTNATYHFKGERWYGHTNRGAYVCKDEADKDGMTGPKK